MSVSSSLRQLLDPVSSSSLAQRFRSQRFQLFEQLLASVPRPVRVLDVGGTSNFWRAVGADHLVRDGDIELVLLNRDTDPAPLEGVTIHPGDATDLSEFDDGAFDVVFSNSVIEHVGGHAEQAAMAREVRRVGRAYWVQTPSYWFPIEPHFHLPGFQWLPNSLRKRIVMRFDTGWYRRIDDPARAEELVTRIKLLRGREMRTLFPGATLHRERVLGLTKSYVAHDGFR